MRGHLIKCFIFLKKLKNIYLKKKRRRENWGGYPQTTIGGGFGHPLGPMGVAEPPLDAQGPPQGFFFYLLFFIFYFKKNYYVATCQLLISPCVSPLSQLVIN
jgi:hypothetical protein